MLRRKAFLGLFFSILLLLPLAVSAIPDIQIVNYTIYDKFGRKAFEGWSPSQTSSPTEDFPPVSDYQYRYFQNISAGDYFTINLTLINKATGELENEGGGLFIQDDVRDFNGYLRGENYNGFKFFKNRAAIANATFRDAANPFSLAQNDSINLSTNMNTSRWLAPGNYSLLFYYEGAGDPTYLWVLIPINNSGSYIYVNPFFLDVPHFNDIAYYDNIPGSGNWSLSLNVTLRNEGRSVGLPPNQLNPSFVNISRFYCDNAVINSSCWEYFNYPTLSVFAGTDQNYGCGMNFTNSSGINCFVRLGNRTYDFELEREIDLGALGVPIVNPPPAPGPSWSYFITSPTVSSLYVIPGAPFNISSILKYRHKQSQTGGNLTEWDNLNYTLENFDIFGNWLSTQYDYPMKSGEKFNFTSATPLGDIPVKDENFTIPTLPNTLPRSTLLSLSLSQYLVWTMNNYSSNWIGDIPCGRAFEPIPIEPTPNWKYCHFAVFYTSAHLLFLLDNDGNSQQELWAFEAPGTVDLIQFEAQNPLSSDENYLITAEYVPTKARPFSPITFNTVPILVPRAITGNAGSLLGAITMDVPFSTPEENFTYKIRSTSARYPSLTDYATLHVIVGAHDVEVVSINKTPSMFIYDPETTPNVTVTVVIRNNLPTYENVSLELIIGGAKYINCNGAPGIGLPLGPQETKVLNCNPPSAVPAYADLTGFSSDNVVISANLELLSFGADSLPQNNFKVDIISIVSSEHVEETVPELDPGVFLALLILSLIIMRKKGGKI
ncbi:MAG TPA: hypothetical protein VJI13_04850 [Candidatus Norongarragalinales archaeon]|nr:hypothetical protein [Candidatus Norongarragalinales archaeon]